MACTFIIEFQNTTSQVVASIKNKVETQGGVFNGDTSGGNFDVSLLGSHITGSYTITGQQMNVDISDKPFIITCNQIKKFIESQLV